MSPTPPTVHRTLYKRDSDGRIRTFFMESRGNAYWSTTGLIDGAQTATSPIYAEEKNVGKKNYRSANDQAIYEVENEYKKTTAACKTGNAVSRRAVGSPPRYTPSITSGSSPGSASSEIT